MFKFMRFILGLIIIACLVGIAFCLFAEPIPENSKQYLPLLNQTIEEIWPDLSIRSMEAGQVEQETCINLKHKKCWNPRAELKTSREYGFGFGQITITDRFNNFEEIKKMHKSLSDWKWEDRYDPYRQLKALVVYDNFIYNKIIGANNDYERLAFTLAAYNGGLGGVIQERQMCKSISNCDSTKWFNNTEKYSRKSKKKYQGYGKSFFEINREYVTNILLIRRHKYVDYLKPIVKVEIPIDNTNEPSTMTQETNSNKGKCHWIDKIANNCE